MANGERSTPTLVPTAAALDDEVPGVWWAVRAPVPLLGMPHPPAGASMVEMCRPRGVGVVLSLIGDHEPTYDCQDLVRESIGLEDLYRLDAPHDPERERFDVLRAVDVVCRHRAAGVGVAVHCHGGTGRTGTVIGATLVMLGHDPEVVVEWLDEVHRLRGRPGWPESPWQATLVRSLG